MFHKEGYWFQIWMVFLQPILFKMELIYQQPIVPQLGGVHPSFGVWERMAGGSLGGLAMYFQKY